MSSGRMPYFFQRLVMEPPFRIVTRAVLKHMKVSIETRARWDLSVRPAYLTGLLAAAEQARRQKINEICAIEFGVAGGDGLVAMQSDAADVERETGVQIQVFGFDMGPSGLPSFIGDHRDHPDVWQPGDYPMDVQRLRARLTERTKLIIGNLCDTIPSFANEYKPPPIGFVSVDVDLYSSSRDALRIFSCPGIEMLWHVPMYFDDIDFIFCHRYGGELLAIEEFNAEHASIKIDRWLGIRNERPFPERTYLAKMMVAHDLESVSNIRLDRETAQLPLRT